MTPPLKEYAVKQMNKRLTLSHYGRHFKVPVRNIYEGKWWDRGRGRGASQPARGLKQETSIISGHCTIIVEILQQL